MRQIPPVPAAWSWAVFEHAGLHAVQHLVQADDQERLEVYAFDLGLAGNESTHGSSIARAALSRNLTAAGSFTNNLQRRESQPTATTTTDFAERLDEIVTLEPLSCVQTPGATHLRFAVVR